jgi:hypothetical protein
MSTTSSHLFERIARLAPCLLLLMGGGGCERAEPVDPQASTDSPASSNPSTGSQPGADEHGDHHGGEETSHGEDGEHGEHGEHGGEEEGHGHDHGGIRLGLKMQHVGHRFAAIWYAGRAEKLEMLDYQLHELRETAGQIQRADIEEHGVDVGKRLEANVLSGLDGLETAARKGDIETFESRYEAIRNGCNGCHDATEHGFIEVEKPTRNPYPNIELGTNDG